MIQTEAKFFGLERGSSDGTVISMTYDVDSAALGDRNGFRIELFREKLSLDLMALAMERMKGSVPEAMYNARVSAVRSAYDRALKQLKQARQEKAPDAAT
jgi:hypothetical protein